MRHHGRFILPAILGVSLCLTGVLWASLDRGAIQGTVFDPQHAVMPGVKVLVKNLDTGVEVKLTTNSVGFYLAPELVPGRYLVHVEATGFATLEIKEVIVTAGSVTTANADMKVGEATQSVEVTAEPPLLDTAASNFSTNLGIQYLQDIPLNGRDIQTLVQLIPGVIQSSGPSGAAFGFNSQFGGISDPMHYVGSSISVNGGQAGANGWYLEGSLNASVGAENVVVNPSPDAVQEFNLVGNGLAAEYGRVSGAVINVVLKSGTNDLHGSAYGYNRNSWFSASNPFARRDENGNPLFQPRVNYNDVGGTIGGPVRLPGYNGKNRTFFFTSYDISFFHQNQNRLLTVPLPNERNGDFRGDPRFSDVCDPANGATNCIYNPFTTTLDADGVRHRQFYVNPVIPQNQIDPLAKWYLDNIPNPNYLDPLQQDPITGCGNTCNNYLGPVGSSLTTQNFSAKVDHIFNEKQKLFVTWLYNPSYYSNFRYPWDGPTAQTNTGVAGANPYDTKNQLAVIGLTSTLSPTLINEARFAYSRQSLATYPNPESVTQTQTVQERVKGLNFLLSEPFQPVPTISWYNGVDYKTGMSFGTVAYQNTVQGQQAYTASDNLTKVMGKHTIKAGVSFRRNNLWSASGYGYNIGFDGYDTADPVTYLGGSGLATFLLGYVGQGGPSSGVQYAPWQTNDDWGLYGQDDFRVRPNLTLSFGLRWDVMGWIRERHNALANVNFGVPNPDAPTYMGRLEYMGSTMHPDRNVFPANKNSFGPRFGFSWSPGSSGKTVIRGGYGMIYSNSMSAVFGQGLGAVSTPGFSFPVTAQITDPTLTTPSFILSQGAPTLIMPDPSENQKTQNQLLGRWMFPFEKARHDPAIQQWSLFVQRELPGNMMISGGYVGSHGTHLMGDAYENIDYVPTKTQQELRSRMNLNYPGDPAIAPLYGCDVDPSTGKSMCSGWYSLERYPQYYAVAPMMRPDGINKYNSAQFRFEKRPSHGLSFLVAYTISKNIVSAGLGALVANTTGPTTISAKGVGRIAFVPGAAGGGVADGNKHTWANDPDNSRAAIALSPDDTPQVFNVAATYEFPIGKGKRFMNRGGVANAIFGGWKWTQNWNAQSGVPMFFQAISTRNGLYSYRLNQIGDPSAGRSSNRQQQEQQYYNGNAFTPTFGPDQATITALSNGVWADGTPVDYDKVDSWWAVANASIRPPGGRTPGYWNMDMGLAKNFYLTESRYFTFRWDIYNAFNHQSLGIPDNGWCLPPNPDGSTDLVHQFDCEFGRITNVQTDPRGMQFSIRFQF